MPADTLCLIFEEDFRFWPGGEDPDNADDYRQRISQMAKLRRRSRSRNKIHVKPRGSVAQEPTPKWTPRRPRTPTGAYRPDEGAKGRAKGKRLSLSGTSHQIEDPQTGMVEIMACAEKWRIFSE